MRGLKLWLISFLAALEFILAVAVLHGIGPMGDGIAEPKVGLVAGTIPGALFTFVIVFLGLEWIEAQAPAAEHPQNRVRRPRNGGFTLSGIIGGSGAGNSPEFGSEREISVAGLRITMKRKFRYLNLALSRS